MLGQDAVLFLDIVPTQNLPVGQTPTDVKIPVSRHL